MSGERNIAMSYTLQDFCSEIHQILVAENNSAGREKVRRKMEELLANKTFIEQFCGPDKKPGVYKLNEDPTTGAVVLSHVMGDGHASPPHDHGNSWAIYGQATEHTVMTEFDRTDDGSDDEAISLEETRQYRLDPGQVGLFDVGQIHSIQYPDNARFVRVTGVDLDGIDRHAYNLKHRTVKTIHSASAGEA
jgi:predicted metal-dependent enzyme (double-stranded beta helix superfamily)